MALFFKKQESAHDAVLYFIYCLAHKNTYSDFGNCHPNNRLAAGSKEYS
jgi:hypothetical protein